MEQLNVYKEFTTNQHEKQFRFLIAVREVRGKKIYAREKGSMLCEEIAVLSIRKDLWKE